MATTAPIPVQSLLLREMFATSGRLHDEDPVQSAVGAVVAVVDVSACPKHVQLVTDQWKWLAKTCSVGDRSVDMASQGKVLMILTWSSFCTLAT